MTTFLLCDNGSSRPQATLQLRQLASKLTEKIDKTIHPVSLQHANRIPADQLGGEPAATFVNFLEDKLQQGEKDFIVLPLFFGYSKALSSFIPEKTELLKQQFGEFNLRIADVVYPLPDGEPLLTNIVTDHIFQSTNLSSQKEKHIVLVDHGSPIPRVTEVRNHLAKAVQNKLPSEYVVDQAVMERREGAEYDFNGSLLAEILEKKALEGVNNIAVILLFFLPGRHAGEGGDIVEICDEVTQRYTDFEVQLSPLIAEHPQFVEILIKRLDAAT